MSNQTIYAVSWIVGSRRAVVRLAAAGLAAFLAGCVATSSEGIDSTPVTASPAPAEARAVATTSQAETERFSIEPLDPTKIDPAFVRREVDYATSEPPGAVVVDPDNHYLYFIEPGGRAMRYGVAVGKEGSSWSGTATIKTKQEWPDWYPTKEMLQRRPDIKDMLETIRSGPGIPGGPTNPIGARGLYLWQGDKDTLYRIHGTTEPYSIGKSVSSGCIRMTNQDVIDLYARVSVGAKVTVLPLDRPAHGS